MTEKTAPPSRHPESVLKVVRLIVDGQRTRAIWHRFFGITSLLICDIIVFHAGSIPSKDRLLCAVSAETVTALVAIGLMKLEGRTTHRE
jgi:hypothetical protein